MLFTVDIGTSTFKSALWNFDGGQESFASVPLTAVSDSAGRHEADAAQWLAAFKTCCAALDAKKHHSLAAVKAIVISGNGPSLTPVLHAPKINSDGLRVKAAPSRLWLDRRAEKASKEVSAAVGSFVDASFFLPKVLDIKQNESPLYERVQFFLGCPEFLAYALTGEARSVFPSEGCERWFWNNAILKTLNLDPAKFPPFIRPTETFGMLLPSAAKLFGLAPNIPVISGGPDFFAAILGSGITEPGQACDRAGTSEGINVCTKDRITDSRLMSYGHPVKPFWNLSGSISTTGRAVQWGKELLGLQTYDEFYALADTARGKSEAPLFLPYLAGERAPIWDAGAKGVIRNLTLSAGRPEFALSILEGICFAIRDVISVMEEAGACVTELRAAGSASGIDTLNQIKADITGRAVLIPARKEAELAGLALIGAYTQGFYVSLAEAASVFARVEKRIEPNTEKSERYAQLFAEYKETYRALAKRSIPHGN